MYSYKGILGIKGATIDPENRLRAPLNSLLNPKMMEIHCIAEDKIARTFTKGGGIGNQSVKNQSTANLLVENLKQKFVKDVEIKKMKDRHTNQSKQVHKELTLSTK